MNISKLMKTVSCALLVAALHITTASAQTAATDRGKTFESLKTLPDWSGAWGANGGGGGRGGQNLGADATAPPDGGRAAREIPPLRDAAALDKLKAQLATARQGDNVARAAQTNGRVASNLKDFGGGICGGYSGNGAFNGRTAGGPEATIEFLFTPGRVTILSDHSMIRRIYTDGRPVPEEDARLMTLTGTSIGHWEGDTLVVTTVGLSPATVITGGVKAGKGFIVGERMYLDEKHTMHIDGTITAPEAYTEPFKYTQVFNRFLDKSYALAEYLTDCDHTDRSIDTTKAAQQFDLTPPADIPPPPTN